MSSDEIEEASSSFLGLKVGDTISLDEVRKMALNEKGTPKEGMGLMESSSLLIFVIQAAGYCQKDKTVNGKDGSVNTVSVVGSIILSITKL